MTRKKTTEEFIEEARKIHGDKYDYFQSIYVKSREKVIIICDVHGKFEMMPNAHIDGKQGCIKCGRIQAGLKSRKTTEYFIEEARRIHGDKYDYSRVLYEKSNKKVTIICNCNYIFEITPNAHIGKQKQGCSKCGGCHKPTTEEFIENAKMMHGNTYDYSKAVYEKQKGKIIIICETHGEFIVSGLHHIHSLAGCQKCSNHYKPTTEEFIKKAKLTHGEKYDYCKVEYVACMKKVIIICNDHGEFEQNPVDHLRNCGCPRCCCYQYSKIGIRWLNFMSKFYDINIQHGENSGEYKIPNTRYKADGYCENLRIIYEFHGDYWHGNPEIYEPNDKTYFNKTFGELYKKTMLKENKIRELGFKLVVMWENDWKKINRSVGVLQKKYRSFRLL
jgi:hypothetical protein